MSLDAPVLEPAERVALPVILAAYTRNAAFAVGAERYLGSLERGKLADIVVLNRPLRVSDDKLDGVVVDMTFSHGMIAYTKSR